VKTTKEKMARITEAWYKDDHYKLIFEWTKTGNLSRREFNEALELVESLVQSGVPRDCERRPSGGLG